MKTWARKQYGFTIVELLIVIVVIAILATISIVAYNGIQARADRVSVQAEHNSLVKKIQLFNVDSSSYPGSIDDCPSPVATNLCLTGNAANTFSYIHSTPGGVGSSITTTDGYELTVKSPRSFVYSSNIERTSSSEFMQYTDLAPLINQYGLAKYRLNFEMKSSDSSADNTTQVYFQNGSTTRHGGLSRTVTVTDSYQHYDLTFTPTNNDLNVSQSMLAFYGTYHDGNRPIVKNLQVSLSE